MVGAATLAVAAGCGGGDGDDETASKDSPGADKPLTKAQFIPRADAICRDVKQAQEPYSERIRALDRVDDLRRLAPSLDGASGESRKGLARLRALPPPREDRATLDAYYAAAARLVAASAQLTDAARSNDRAKGRKVAATSGPLSAEQMRLADEYGFEECDDAF